MKHAYIYNSSAFLFALALMMVSCSKDAPSVAFPDDSLIRFGIQDYADIDIETKAVTPVTSMSSFNVSCTTGSAGSETSKWTSTSFASDGAGTPTYSASRYWPVSDQSYHFYASNATLDFAAGGTTIAASTNSNIDYVCAYMPSPTYKTKNTLTFEHIFARIGTVTVAAVDGYTVSGVTVKVTPIKSGTYNLRTGSGRTDATGWSSTSTGSASTIASAVGSNSNDLYLVPGTYTLTSTWTATKGAYTKTFTNVTSTVTFKKGKISALTVNLGGDATAIAFGVSITSWTTPATTALEFAPPS